MKPDLSQEDPKTLVPWAGNPRRNDHAVDSVISSIKRFGFSAPVVANRKSREVIAGHTRLKAALKLGLKSIPVRWMDMEQDEAHALALADNKIGEIADWDEVALSAAISDMADKDVDLSGLGWEDSDLSVLLGDDLVSSGATHPSDDVPDEQDMVISTPGSVYELGPHRVICGNSSEERTWMIVDEILDGKQAELVWTDPPYGVSFLSPGRTSKVHDIIENDSLSTSDLYAFLSASLSSCYKRTKPGGVWYVAAPSGDKLHAFSLALSELPTMFRHGLVWVKDRFVFGRSDRHYRHEFIFYGWKDGAAHVWSGGRKHDSVIEIPRPVKSDEHPTMKPVMLVVECLKNHKPNKGTPLVIEPFGGSGTTLMACAQLGYNSITIELMPKYVDVIRRRYTKWARDNGLEPGAGALE